MTSGREWIPVEMKRTLSIVAILAVFALGWASVPVARRIWRVSHTDLNRAFPPPPLDFRAARPVYPFSLVPGGVYDSTELSTSANADPVVRRHYRDVRIEGLWTARTSRPMLAYVSFRKGDSVGWTKKKVKIPKGELVLTDGTNLIRARCGNRIRQLPPPLDNTTTVLEDPPEMVFETPAPPIIEIPESPRPQLVEVASKVPLPPVGPGPSGPPIVPVVLPPYHPGNPGQPLAPVPEPGTIMLMLTGMGMLGGAAWRRRR